ncbi:dUTP diphosphatase [Hydrogenimonas cancrithermarum]|uniref:dUTPase n=1 Tax=Hydrogenimonas cancrithermarum TaxID=2993563 RepID=A0ABM8FLS4_9BACT|nr:dUTP diphosphatase [Hydrogenimonas cancrithermarum]BDY13315.1 dUTPase [Hydrogenimonas cancrithermarum]
MDKLSKLVEMFRLQQRLNDDTNGPKWREGVTKQGKVINWKRCIVMETAELVDSFSWKHWKNIAGGIDLENIKIEMVDIWHFVMSYILRFHTPEEAAKLAFSTMKVSQIKLPKAWSEADNARLEALLEPFENLMAMALVKTDDEVYQEELLEQFWECVDAVGMSFDELYRLYIGKNALNQFRQRHGYKEGTYVKVWNGKEDNVVMQEILAANPDITYDALLAALEKAYEKVRSEK